MYRTIVLFPKDKSSELLIELQKKCICQPKTAESDLLHMGNIEAEQRIVNYESRLSFIYDNLKQYGSAAPANMIKGLFSNVPPKNGNGNQKFLTEVELFQKIGDKLAIIEDFTKENLQNIEKTKEKIAHNEFMISNLNYLPEINLSLLSDTEFINKHIGLISTVSAEKIKKELKEISVLILRKIDDKISLLIVECLKKDSQRIESKLHEIGFETLVVPFEDEKPSDLLKKLKHENQLLAEEEKKLKENLHILYESNYAILTFFMLQIKKLRERLSALKSAKTSDTFSNLEFWVPAKEFEKFKSSLESVSKSYYISYEERMDAPTLLNNPQFVKPFETITEMYSLPKYSEFDPTPLVAITFSLFFGFVVADFFYGSIILALGILLMRGKGSYDAGTKILSTMIISLGTSTIVFGIIFGSYFGNFFSTNLGIKIPYLLDPMAQVITVLMIAIAIGLTHLSIGLCIGFFENLRKGKFLDGLQAQGVWIITVLSIISFVLKWNIAGLILIAIAALLQIGLNFRSSGFAPALLSVFSFAGFVGDTGSYARLMALSVSTGGIALAFNLMVGMAVGIPYVGIIMAILIFVIGHTFNILMGSLGGFVHPLRLHFLEHFSKYYDGGGTKYVPFGKVENE